MAEGTHLQKYTLKTLFHVFHTLSYSVFTVALWSEYFCFSPIYTGNDPKVKADTEKVSYAAAFDRQETSARIWRWVEENAVKETPEREKDLFRLPLPELLFCIACSLRVD